MKAMRAENKIGLCSFKINGGFTIQLLRNWWDETVDENLRLELMYHEAAHCLFE